MKDQIRNAIEAILAYFFKVFAYFGLADKDDVAEFDKWAEENV